MRFSTCVAVALLLSGCGDLFFTLERPLGEACIQDGECASGACSDGVCCDVDCDAIACVSCLGAETGGTDGACLPVILGTDPADECPGVFGCEGPGNCQECDDFADFTPCEDGWCYDLVCRPEVCTSVGCNIGGPGFVLGDTNQRACFDASTEISCESCDPWCGQDAQSGWDTEFGPEDRFLRSSGDEPVVTDAATGLEWRGCFAGLSGADCSGGSVLAVPWSDAHNTCRLDAWADGGWRLPDVYELQSLVDSGSAAAPTLDSSRFPGAPSGSGWTASVVVGGVLSVDFGDGRVESLPSENSAGVLCVRGGRSPISEPRFGLGAETVTDRRTGLEWQRSGSPAELAWLDALTYCDTLTLAGSSDWRLPNRVELGSLVDVRERAVLIDTEVFEDEARSRWSSTSNRADLGSAWRVDFGLGETLPADKSDLLPVRCVRNP